MTTRAEWLAILDVALDALRVKNYERAWELYGELDRLHPTWLFEIRRAPVRRDTGKQQTSHLKMLAWLLRLQGCTYKQIGDLFGLSVQRASELHAGGARIVLATGLVLGYIEDDFLSPERRREARRRGLKLK